MTVYVSKYMYIYTYFGTTYTWTIVYNAMLSTTIEGMIFWVSYSPTENFFYNTRGNKMIQVRNTTDYSVISERNYGIYSTISVSNLQFTSTIGDEVLIQLDNSTSNKSFL